MSIWTCLPSMPPVALVSSAASLMAFDAEIPYADVAPVRDRKAPILMLSVRDSGIEHAETTRHRITRNLGNLRIWRNSLQDYRIFGINWIFICLSWNRVIL